MEINNRKVKKSKKRHAVFSTAELEASETIERLGSVGDAADAQLKRSRETLQRSRGSQRLSLRQDQSASKTFSPTEYKIEFPFFRSNGEEYLSLLDRDDIVNEINEVASRKNTIKYTPIVISTSRGMGKTFLMKMIALQKVPHGLECQLIHDAGRYGRILSFDFTKTSYERTPEAIRRFFPKLMVFYLSRIFHDCVVDGIYFQKVDFDLIASYKSTQRRFNAWKDACMHFSTDDMITEYIRLTNIAFSVNCEVPPVFLLDEIQQLCVTTTEPSTYDSRFHTLLSLLLTQLAGQYNSLCICTGTNNGRILKITDMSRINPRVLSLTPLKTGFLQNWEEMTNHDNLVSGKGTLELKETQLIKSLIYATYKIPRLLVIAHDVWFKHLHNSQRDVHCLIEYEAEAKLYYKEMEDIWYEFTPQDIAHMIFATGCRWTVRDPDRNVPGTSIAWNFLIEKSLIFPYHKDYYLFPFGLIWSNTDHCKEHRLKVEQACQALVKNVDIKHLFMSYSEICICNAYDLGMLFEKLLTASFAIKYYLYRLEYGEVDVKFDSLYNLHQSAPPLHNRTIDFSQGIDFPDKEATVESCTTQTVTRNRESPTAHHDIILYSKEGPIPLQVKASFKTPTSKQINSQLKVCKQSDKHVTLLIWISLINETSSRIKQRFNQNVVFLDGSGVCNGISIDVFRAAKIVQSVDKKSP